MSEDLPTKEAAVRALKIMDALHQLARKYPVLEVLAVVKQWAAYMDGQIQRMAGHSDGCDHCHHGVDHYAWCAQSDGSEEAPDAGR